MVDLSSYKDGMRSSVELRGGGHIRLEGAMTPAEF